MHGELKQASSSEDVLKPRRGGLVAKRRKKHHDSEASGSKKKKKAKTATLLQQDVPKDKREYEEAPGITTPSKEPSFSATQTPMTPSMPPPASNYKLLAEDKNIKLTYEVRTLPMVRDQVLVSVIFTNLSLYQLKEMELNILDTLNTKMLRRECVIRGIESGLKKASVAAKYGVSDTTVSTIYKNKDKLRQQLQQDSSSLSWKRIRTSKYEDVDAALFRWFREVRAQSIPVKADTISKCFKRAGFVRNAEALEDDEQSHTSLADETLNTDDVWSCLVDSNFVTATDTFQEFADAGESKLSVCKKASTDDAIVAAVRGSAEVATGDESDSEDDVDPTPEPDFLCKDTLEYLSKVKTYCAKNSSSEKSLQCLSFVEDEIVRSAVREHRQTKITAFFC
ncbi:hypothetical protein HPB51_004301 [Rhipicephalus microplus]|uniref:HTH psq-type domain-containing protein n=1 Tax=Rhipicephalus microplus TaxID=6941 RepID=A0A9J6ELQ3_RHIMP|nr:hypothetical protein HPB51_004301 [Rhipicephalus microplus]